MPLALYIALGVGVILIGIDFACSSWNDKLPRFMCSRFNYHLHPVQVDIDMSGTTVVHGVCPRCGKHVVAIPDGSNGVRWIEG